MFLKYKLGTPPEKLRKSLLIGSILDLNTLLKKPQLKKALKDGLGDGEVDLGVPLVALTGYKVPAYAADALPPELAATPAVKPGSRDLK
mgnify:CR=1 FL=1